jgi:hypothetical protein
LGRYIFNPGWIHIIKIYISLTGTSTSLKDSCIASFYFVAPLSHSAEIQWNPEFKFDYCFGPLFGNGTADAASADANTSRSGNRRSHLYGSTFRFRVLGY